MKKLILKKIKNSGQFFIGILLVVLVVLIGFNDKLLSESLYSFKRYHPEKNNINCLEMYGNVKESKNWETWPLKNIEDAEIIIFNTEYKVLEKLHSDKIGMCVMKLSLNDQFIIRVSKEGYITKTIHVDTRLSETKLAHYYINFEIDMFEDIPGLDVNILTKPIAIVSYNNYLNCFDYDFNVTDAINEKLKKKYLVYYKHHSESKMGLISDRVKNTESADIVEKSSTEIVNNTPTKSIRKTPTNISKSNNQINIINDNSNKSNKDFVNTANKKGVYSLNDITYNGKNNNISKVNIKANSFILANVDSSEIVFKIQISSIDEYLTPDAKLFKKFGKVNEYIYDGEHKYTIGEFRTLASATKTLNEINVNGYKDAFLVAFYKGQRISIDDAKLAKYIAK